MAERLGLPRFDTRGLPEGYDPLGFYQYRIDIRKAEAVGLESYVYKLMPESMIKSMAIAIDPFSQFKTSPGVITPVNRTKYRATTSVLFQRGQQYYRYNKSGSSSVNYLNIPGNTGPFVDYPTVVLNNDFYPYQRQEALPNVLKDTTRRTRLLGSDQGEMEKISGFIASPPRKTITGDIGYGLFTLNDNNVESHLSSVSRSMELAERSHTGTAATLSRANYDAHVVREREVALGLIQKHSLAMFKGVNPQSRNYSLVRNIIELRDIPGSISSIREVAQNLIKLEASLKIPSHLIGKIRSFQPLGKAIPNEYLSYHFGWKQLVKDVYDLCYSPAKISKQINFLLSRNGKDTTYRSSRKFLTVSKDVSGFDYEYMGGEEDLVSSSRVERETELRMVINTNFRFPDVNIPQFVNHLFADKLGAYPRLIDVYNLTPWTWLVDWFTGLGNYLEIIENINYDRSLINWGMITAETNGNLLTDFKSRSLITHTYAINLPDPWTPRTIVNEYVENRHQSRYDYTFQLRKDMSNIMDVNATSDPSTLTDYQRSILGALILQRTDIRRPKPTRA